MINYDNDILIKSHKMNITIFRHTFLNIQGGLYARYHLKTTPKLLFHHMINIVILIKFDPHLQGD
jgi:hypothetical protein